MWKITVYLGFVTVAAANATIPTIGPCTAKVQPLQIDFDQFASANGGVWHFSKVTETPNNSKFKSLKSVTTPTGTPGVYDLVIYYEDITGQKGIFAKETEYGNYGPVVISEGKDTDYTLKIYFLKYEPGRYAYYYICSDDGGDTTADYRYVVSTGKLSEGESSDIDALDCTFKFNGNLVNIL